MASASHPQVIIYTTVTCPDCWALKAWLTREEIEFEERDLSAPKIMTEAKARTGVRVAPITLVAEKIFYGTCQTIMTDGAPCGQNVSIPVGATLWECGCGTPYDADQLEADRRERVADTLGTVGELVRLAKHVGVTVSRHKVNRLVTAGRLQSRTEGKAGAMYRLGDLLDTLGA